MAEKVRRPPTTSRRPTKRRGGYEHSSYEGRGGHEQRGGRGGRGGYDHDS